MAFRLIWADLIDCWRLWVTTALVVILMTSAVVAAVVFGAAGDRFPEGGALSRAGVGGISALNVLLCAAAGFLALSGSIRQLVSLRSRDFALWSLIGISASWARRVFWGQLLVVAFLGIVIGILGGRLLGQILLYYAVHFYLPGHEVPEARISVAGAVAPAVVAAACVIGAALWPSRRLFSLDGLRILRDGAAVDPAGISRIWLMLGIGACAAVAMWMRNIRSVGDERLAGSAAVVMLAALIVLYRGFSTWLPSVLLQGARFVCPWRWVGVRLGLESLASGRARLVSVSGAVAVATFLPAGFQSIGASFVASERGDGIVGMSGGVGFDQLVLTVGLPTLVAITGSALSMYASGRSREAEFALSSLAGASPALLLTQACCEGILASLIGWFCGLLLLALFDGCLYWLLSAFFFSPQVVSPAIGLSVGALLAAATTSLCAVLPVRACLKQAPQSVIRRLLRG